MLVKRLVQLQFYLDKADKPQVMFYFPEIKELVHLEVCKCQGPNSGFTILLS